MLYIVMLVHGGVCSKSTRFPHPKLRKRRWGLLFVTPGATGCVKRYVQASVRRRLIAVIYSPPQRWLSDGNMSIEGTEMPHWQFTALNGWGGGGDGRGYTQHIGVGERTHTEALWALPCIWQVTHKYWPKHQAKGYAKEEDDTCVP